MVSNKEKKHTKQFMNQSLSHNYCQELHKGEAITVLNTPSNQLTIISFLTSLFKETYTPKKKEKEKKEKKKTSNSKSKHHSWCDFTVSLHNMQSPAIIEAPKFKVGEIAIHPFEATTILGKKNKKKQSGQKIVAKKKK